MSERLRELAAAPRGPEPTEVAIQAGAAVKGRSMSSRR